MVISGRKYSAGNSYRYGFNGKEKSDEIYGEGNAYDFGARIQDPRLGKWFSLDPLQRKYPNESHYAYVSNSPLLFMDPDGKDKIVTLTVINKDGTQIKIKSVNPNYFYTQTNYGYYETTFSKFDVTSNIVIDYSKLDANGKPTGSVTNDIIRTSEKSTSMVGYAFQNVENALTDRIPVINEFGFVLSGEAAGDNHTLDIGGFSKSAEIIDIGNLMKNAGNLREFSGKLEVWDFADDVLKNSPKLNSMLSGADNLLDATQATIDAINAPTSPSVNTKKGTTNAVKTTTQQQTAKTIPKATRGDGSIQTATYGRKDSIGKDGSVWDVPTLIPVNKSNTKKGDKKHE